MEKKEWMKPLAVAQRFVANEYVAACGEENKVYKFKCDAPAGTLYYYPNAGLGKERLGNYHPCGKTHEAPTSDPFYNGFVDYNGNRQEDDGEAVIVWVEYGWWDTIRNAHATTNLNISSWETAKS